MNPSMGDMPITEENDTGRVQLIQDSQICHKLWTKMTQGGLLVQALAPVVWNSDLFKGVLHLLPQKASKLSASFLKNNICIL